MFRVQVSGFRVRGSWFSFQVAGFRIKVPGFRVQGSGFRVQGSGFRVQGSGFRVFGLTRDPWGARAAPDPSLRATRRTCLCFRVNITNRKNKLMNLCGNRLFQRDFMKTFSLSGVQSRCIWCVRHHIHQRGPRVEPAFMQTGDEAGTGY